MSLSLIRSGRLRCVYCGDTATHADHVPAVIYKYYVTPNERYCVPSCKQCNLTLGRKKLFDVEDRRIWIQGYYRKKYRRILNLPDIDEKELGYNLKTLIQSGKSTRQWILHRISFIPNDLDDLRFPYYQDGRQSQDRSSFLEAIKGLPEAIASDFETEIASLIENDPWINGNC